MLTNLANFAASVLANVEKVIVGKREQIELLLVAMYDKDLKLVGFTK